MQDIKFFPKEIIDDGNYRLEVLSVEKTETYGPQIAIKVRVLDGGNDGYKFMDYANRDKDTGDITQGSKAWSIFEACLGKGFFKDNVGLNDLVGKTFKAKVTQTRTGSRNKLEFGTIGPDPEEDFDFME